MESVVVDHVMYEKQVKKVWRRQKGDLIVVYN